MRSTLRWIIGLIIYKIAPVKKNRYVFQSYHGHFSDSPRVIYEHIKQKDPSAELIWILNREHIENYCEDKKYVLAGTIKAKWVMGSAKVIIDNVFCDKEYTVYEDIPGSLQKAKINSLLKNKKKQFAFTTFHGTPFKTTDRDVVNSKVIDFFCPGTEMILGNKYSADVFRHVTFCRIPMRVLGSPRNDILFLDGIKESIKQKLNLSASKKYLLYAPTFRNEGRDTAGKNVYRSGLEQIDLIDFKKLFAVLSDKFGGEWCIILRFHQQVSKLVNWDQLNIKYNNRFINGNLYDEMSEYLVAADILLTDYSSSIFDFSLTKKPCFIYANDLDYFVLHERGLYIPLEQLPFPYATDFDGLIKKIEYFDINKYETEVCKMHNRFGYVDDRYSGDRVADYILEKASK